MPDDSQFRNPPKLVRALLVAGVFAIPGATAGLMLGLFLSSATTCLALGTLVAAVAGYLIELQ